MSCDIANRLLKICFGDDIASRVSEPAGVLGTEENVATAEEVAREDGVAAAAAHKASSERSAPSTEPANEISA